MSENLRFKRFLVDTLIAGSCQYLPTEYIKVYEYIDKDKIRHHFTYEQVCSMAAKELDEQCEEIYRFKALKAGLKKYGYERLYEHIIGENIDA